jgi:glucose/arabinose dehydrogenase
MFGFVRYSFTIAASICIAVLTAQRAFGQVLETPSYSLAQVVPIPTAARPPQVPDGFSTELVTSAQRNPRAIREAPNGDLFVADATFGAVRVMRVLPGRTTPVRDAVFASRLNQPFGIAFYPLGSHPRWVYIANSDGVVRFRYRNGDLKATGKPEQIIAGIPTTHHYARDVVVSPDGHRLYFSVGSVHVQSVAAGLRNCEGMTVLPATGELSCIVNERDELGDTPHSASLQMAVYRGNSPPPAYTRTAAAASESVQAGYDAAKGRDLYIANCSACH